MQKSYTYFKNYTKKLGDVKTPLTYEAATPLGSIKVPKTVSEMAQDLKKATVQMAKKLDEKIGGKGTGNLSYTQKVDKYQERTQAIRDNLPSKYKKYGNVAVADVNISGLKSEFKAHSRIHKEYEGGFSYVIGEGKFPAKSVNHKGETDAPNAFLRANDTERKILEDISRQLGDDKTVKGTIDLFTELPACGSCTDIILQFRKEYPNIKLNVYSGEFKD
ncbi:deaminase domain-containing protein [Lysinibacillus sp. 3P01SB]|uniref:deaminase domain-containing protein n=1 Tax=Lysinibacillus sp. 3P01SB TaxID=3132284 RepID=UPI0039A6F238